MHDDDDDACLFYFCAVGHFFCKRGKKAKTYSFSVKRKLRSRYLFAKFFGEMGRCPMTTSPLSAKRLIMKCRQQKKEVHFYDFKRYAVARKGFYC